LKQGEFFEIIGKLLYAGLDGEGNIHIILKKKGDFWSRIAVRFLKGEENHILKFRIMPWNHKRSGRGFKNPQKSTFAVGNVEVEKEK